MASRPGQEIAPVSKLEVNPSIFHRFGHRILDSRVLPELISVILKIVDVLLRDPGNLMGAVEVDRPVELGIVNGCREVSLVSDRAPVRSDAVDPSWPCRVTSHLGEDEVATSQRVNWNGRHWQGLLSYFSLLSLKIEFLISELKFKSVGGG